MEKKNNFVVFIIYGLVLLGIGVGIFFFLNSDKKEKEESNNETNTEIKKEEENKKEETTSTDKTGKVDIINLNSKTRPLAVAVNNTPVAVKVQEGLNKAYLVYELPTEGSTSRLLALFKDEGDVTVGTIRSARHNFADYAYESDAVLTAYGWSHYAEDQLRKQKIINNINGIISEGKMWRNNPENLASEHTAYLSTAKVRDYAKNNKKYNMESNNTVLLKYNTGDVDLSSKSGSKNANNVTIVYGNITTKFKYDSNTKMYTRIVNDKVALDHNTKEPFVTKNVIVQKITYKKTDDNYYWDLHTVGNGDGYFITNGKYVPIKWSKADRKAKTKFTYLDGKEIEVSDGRTYIEVQVTSRKTTIE